MEPVPRPEWSSPLETGKHIRSFCSSLSEQPTREVLVALAADSQLLDFLERHPLGGLEFSGRMPMPSWNGSYDPQSRDLVVNAFRSSASYGREFYPPSLKSVSSAGRSLIEAMQRTLYRELGHSILDSAGPETELQAGRLLRSGRAMPVSIRARKDAAEYFRETFSACRFEDGLADKDPEGYDMVEAILRMVWEKVNPSEQQRDEQLNAIGCELDELRSSGALDFDRFKALFRRALAICGPDDGDMEMFCHFAGGEGWWDWMVKELREAPSRRVA